jgi:uncharacterized protein YhaN
MRVVDLQRHRDLELRLTPGLNVIRGPNEAGKSTIQRGLELAFFRRCTATGKDIDGMRRWGAEEASCPSVELDLELDGAKASLVKRFGGTKGTTRLEVDGEVLTDPAAVDRRLAELTGISSEKFFRSTASVHHQELSDLERDESTLRDRLQQAMTGADRGTSKARRRLEDAIKRYQAEGPKNPGLLKQLREEAARLSEEVAAGETALTRLEQDHAALVSARERRMRSEAKLAEQRKGLEDSERAVALRTQQEAAKTLYERTRRAAELGKGIEEAERSHPAQVPLAVLRTGVERLRGLEARISELRAELTDEAQVGYQVEELPKAWAPFAAAGIGLLFVALGLAGAALNVGPVLAAVAVTILAVAVVLILIAFRRRRRGIEITKQHQMVAEQISRRLRGRSEVAEELAQNERHLREELTRLRLADTPTAETLLTAETEHTSGLEQLKAELRGLFAELPSADDLVRFRDQAAAEVEQKTHALAGMGAIGADPQAHRERFRAGVTAVQAELRQADEEEGAARGRVEANQVDSEAVASRAEKLSEIEDRLSAAERRLRVYRTTLAALDDAERSTMKKAARYLEQTMGEDLARITGGRYSRVSVNEQTLEFRAWSGERRDDVDVRELSQGTLDQVYLAARLGLVRQVTQDKRPPLVFDDPFLTFDDERAAAAVVLLKQVAADHQVLYLTTSDRYDAVADNVIELPQPEAMPVPPADPEPARPDEATPPPSEPTPAMAGVAGPETVRGQDQLPADQPAEDPEAA